MNNPFKIFYYNSLLYGILLGFYLTQYFEYITVKIMIFLICTTVCRLVMYFVLKTQSNVLCSLCIMIFPVLLMLIDGIVYRIGGGIIFLIGAFGMHSVPDYFWKEKH